MSSFSWKIILAVIGAALVALFTMIFKLMFNAVATVEIEEYWNGTIQPYVSNRGWEWMDFILEYVPTFWGVIISISLIFFTIYLLCAKFVRSSSSHGSSVRIHQERRLSPTDQKQIAEHLEGVLLGQERLTIFYFAASEECADLADDIAHATTLAGWSTVADTNIFGDNVSASDVNIQIGGKGHSSAAAAALESALKGAGLQVHVTRFERGQPNVSIYVGRPS